MVCVGSGSLPGQPAPDGTAGVCVGRGLCRGPAPLPGTPVLLAETGPDASPRRALRGIGSRHHRGCERSRRGRAGGSGPGAWPVGASRAPPGLVKPLGPSALGLGKASALPGPGQVVVGPGTPLPAQPASPVQRPAVCSLPALASPTLPRRPPRRPLGLLGDHIPDVLGFAPRPSVSGAPCSPMCSADGSALTANPLAVGRRNPSPSRGALCLPDPTASWPAGSLWSVPELRAPPPVYARVTGASTQQPGRPRKCGDGDAGFPEVHAGGGDGRQDECITQERPRGR